MKYAYIENNRIKDIVSVDPYTVFHLEVAKLYNVEVDDYVEVTAELVDGVWVNPTVPLPDPNYVPEPVLVVPPKLTPIEFKMCFTSEERITITALKSTDVVIADAYSILDDVRLTEVDLSLNSNIALIDYLATKVSALTSSRVLEIKAGVIL